MADPDNTRSTMTVSDALFIRQTHGNSYRETNFINWGGEGVPRKSWTQALSSVPAVSH